MKNSFQLLIVDDQSRARQSLSALLTIDFPSIHIFEASTGKEALHQVETILPNLVVMDVLMPECDGIQATRLIKAIYPRTKIILYSMYAEYKKAAISAGADSFITKGEPSKTLIDTIRFLINTDSDSIPTRVGE